MALVFGMTVVGCDDDTKKIRIIMKPTESQWLSTLISQIL